MVVRFIILLITVYRRCISPFNPPCCRFTPSCSLYAQQALREHRLFRGLLLAAGRLMRCHPFSRGGYDPVPENRNAPAYSTERRSCAWKDVGINNAAE